MPKQGSKNTTLAEAKLGELSMYAVSDVLHRKASIASLINSCRYAFILGRMIKLDQALSAATA